MTAPLLISSLQGAVSSLQRCRMFLFTLAVGLCIPAVISPSVASAASYVVWACADGSGKRQLAADWKPVRVGSDLAPLSSTCGDTAAEPTARLQASSIQHSTNTPDQAGTGWNVDAAPGTTITGLDLWWTAIVGSFNPADGSIQILAPHSIYLLQPPTREQGIRFGGEEALGAGSEPSAYSETNHQSYRGLTSGKVTLMAWCNTLCRSAEGTGMWRTSFFAAYRVKTTVDDSAPPKGSATGLADGGRVSSQVAVQASANDVGGGVREITLRVDGRVVQRVAAGGRCADLDTANDAPYEYDLMKPCPSDLAATLSLSPEDLADGGRHVVSVVATDAAGQDSVLQSVRTALTAPKGFFGSSGFANPDLNLIADRVPNGVNAGPANARMSFVVRRGKRTRHLSKRIVGSRVRQRITGRVTSVTGAPIVGARVWRFVATAPGVWELSGKPLISSKTGRVTGLMPSKRPSRDVRLVYFPFSDSNANVQSPTARLAVRAASSITSDRKGYRNGDTALFSGRITTRPMAAAKQLIMQALVRGKWRPFATTRASASGRWTHRYRFSATRRPTVYRFRVVIPAERENGASWAQGRSRTVRVFVRP